MLVAQLGTYCELQVFMSWCFRTVQLGGLRVLLTFETTFARKDWLGAAVFLDLSPTLAGEVVLELSAVPKPSFCVFFTLVNVFCCFSTMSANVNGSLPVTLV